MLISRSSVSELVNLLTMAGLEVERATPIGEGFEKVIVVEVGLIQRYPQCGQTDL